MSVSRRLTAIENHIRQDAATADSPGWDLTRASDEELVFYENIVTRIEAGEIEISALPESDLVRLNAIAIKCGAAPVER